MEELKFEDAMKKLEEIANELENNDLSLEESVKKFEEGMNLSKQCKDSLDKAEKQITILIDGQDKEFDPNQE